MNRWINTGLMVSVACGATGAVSACDMQKAPCADERPNFLIVLSDDHSAAHVGCYGNPDILTPNIDRFAAQGMKFTRAYAMSPQSAPNRATILTGRSPVAVDMTRFYVPLAREYKTFPEDMREVGYYTGVAGRCYHLDGHPDFRADFPLEVYSISQGMRTFPDRLDYVNECPEGQENSETIMSQFLDYMDKRDKSKPFFLELSYSDPHRPYTAPKVHDPEKLHLAPQYPDTKLVREDLAAYYDEIHRFDRDFGEILAYLDKNGLAENTVVLFMGDNGGAQFRGKGTLYEWGIRVPYIIRWPGHIAPGTESDELVSCEDVAPTFLEIADIPVRKEISGVSLLPLISDSGKPVRDYVFSERGNHGSGAPTGTNNFDQQRCIVGKRYKLIFNVLHQLPHAPVDYGGMPFWREIVQMNRDGKLDEKFSKLYFAPHRPMFELFDLEKDPWEFENLYGRKEYAEIQRELVYELSYWMMRDRDFCPLPARK